MDYTGAAVLETHTVLYGRDGVPKHGAAILRTPQGARLLARVDPGEHKRSRCSRMPIDPRSAGTASSPVPWTVCRIGGSLNERLFSQVLTYERLEGHVGLVTLNRPELATPSTPR